ncbi:hypothetical protein CATMIT_01716, partial [Catenibacterium mitsuokai DSM 15897]
GRDSGWGIRGGPSGKGAVREPWMPPARSRPSGPRQHDLALVLARPVQHGGVADALDQGGAGALGDAVDQGVAGLAVLGADLDLDQLVVFQGQVDLGEQGIGHPLCRPPAAWP